MSQENGPERPRFHYEPERAVVGEAVQTEYSVLEQPTRGHERWSLSATLGYLTIGGLVVIGGEFVRTGYEVYSSIHSAQEAYELTSALINSGAGNIGDTDLSSLGSILKSVAGAIDVGTTAARAVNDAYQTYHHVQNAWNDIKEAVPASVATGVAAISWQISKRFDKR